MHADRSLVPIFSRILLLLTILCCACLVSCGEASSLSSTPSQRGTQTTVPTQQSTRTAVPAHQGILAVTVLTSPACPGPQAADRPCPPRPASKVQVQIELTSGNVVMTATTDQAGQLNSTLAPGNYLLSVQHAAPSMIGKQQNTSVTIREGQTTTVRIVIDSGIR